MYTASVKTLDLLACGRDEIESRLSTMRAGPKTSSSCCESMSHAATFLCWHTKIEWRKDDNEKKSATVV